MNGFTSRVDERTTNSSSPLFLTHRPLLHLDERTASCVDERITRG